MAEGKDPLGNRQKAYEAVWDQCLPARMPVILRLDGNSFSKFTKEAGFQKPFDDRMVACMSAAMRAVLEYCSGSMVGYTQSDEITILLRNDLTLESDPFLANRVQKICSLTAAVASMAFYQAYCLELTNGAYRHAMAPGSHSNIMPKGLNSNVTPHFDCRVFVVPKEEVVNTFLWRQADAFKNCVSSVAWYSLLEKYGEKKTHRMLQGLTTNQRQELVFQELGINVNNLPTHWKRGMCMYRVRKEIPIQEAIGDSGRAKYEQLLAAGHIKEDQVVVRNAWTEDREIPLFSQDRSFIERFV